MKKIALIIGSMIAGGIISAAGFTWFAKAEPPAEKTSTAERKILFWYDPMYPNTRFDKPGKSPFMDMDLVPKYADEESSASGVRIDPTQTQNLGVKTATVTRGPLTFAQSFPANVSYNEYQYAIVQARAAGFIDKVYPLTVGDKVQKGTPLLDLTIPDGNGIPIEERDKNEVRTLYGVQTAPATVEVYNPAFDVTPHSLVTGIITEKGVIYPPFKESLQKLFG